MQVPTFLQPLLDSWLLFLAEDPVLRLLQGAMLLGAVIVVFLVFHGTRDILLRTESFWYMFFSILLIACLPVVGFFLYLLLRPARTIKERELEAMVRQIHHRLSEARRHEKSGKHHSHGPQKQR